MNLQTRNQPTTQGWFSVMHSTGGQRAHQSARSVDLAVFPSLPPSPYLSRDINPSVSRIRGSKDSFLSYRCTSACIGAHVGEGFRSGSRTSSLTSDSAASAIYQAKWEVVVSESHRPDSAQRTLRQHVFFLHMRWRDLPAPECIAAEGQKQIL
jgi:hypothetical protein